MKYQILSIMTGLSALPLMAADVTVSADITADTSWTADNTYLMNQPIFVRSGATLTIEPGTLILGDQGGTGAAPTFGSLIITRDATIVADGTPAKPIIFTARAERDGIDDDPNVMPQAELGDASFWGGVILLGNSQVNNVVSGVQTGENVIEGFPTTGGDTSLITYGGGATPNNSDSSGVLRYVSIRFGGFEFAPNNEINGLTLGGVGSGTTIENIEVFSNSDDGVEFFGGTVNTKNVAVAFCHDESFDLDAGHAGFHQFWFAIQNSDPGIADNGDEWDGGLGSSVTQAPFATTRIYNMTLIGTGAAESGSVDNGIALSDNFAGTLANSVIHDFNGVGLSTASDGVGSPKPNFFNNTWGSFGQGGGIVDNIGGPGTLDPAGSGNSAVGTDPMFRSIGRLPDGSLDPRPASDSSLLDSSLAAFPADAPPGFFEDVDYRGAFGTTQSCNWLQGWSYLSQKGYLSTADDVAVTSDISADTTWTADKTYLLNQPVFVINGATLTIEPGTLILGDQGGN